ACRTLPWSGQLVAALLHDVAVQVIETDVHRSAVGVDPPSGDLDDVVPAQVRLPNRPIVDHAERDPVESGVTAIGRDGSVEGGRVAATEPVGDRERPIRE